MKKHKSKFHDHKFIHASGWLHCPSCGLTKHNPYVGPAAISDLKPDFWYWVSAHPGIGYGDWYSDVIYTVPAGKRLIVEFVNFSCNTLEVNQFMALGQLIADAFTSFIRTDFLTEKFIHCHCPLSAGYGLRLWFSQRDKYKARDFQVMIHGYIEPV